MKCRPHCGACCIAPSIHQAFLGMPDGKAAGERCIHLDSNASCRLFTHPERPKVCAQFSPEPEFCGNTRTEALALISAMELETQ